MVQIESLEGRLFLSTTAMDGPLLTALSEGHGWITFAPPQPFNPNTGAAPSTSQLRDSLTRLYKEGWRGLVTYSLDGPLAQVPKLAKLVGFKKVIAGIYWYDSAQLQREHKAALAQRRYIDGYVVGNEGLGTRYTKDQLITEIRSLKGKTRKPVATTEVVASYQADPSLMQVGDWVFPNIQPWFATHDVLAAGKFTADQYGLLHNLAPGREIIVKESWWPTAGAPGASATNQVIYFKQLSKTGIDFIWGEAYDQFWKTAEGPQGPYWGLHTSTGAPKLVIRKLGRIYADR